MIQTMSIHLHQIQFWSNRSILRLLLKYSSKLMGIEDVETCTTAYSSGSIGSIIIYRFFNNDRSGCILNAIPKLMILSCYSMKQHLSLVAQSNCWRSPSRSRKSSSPSPQSSSELPTPVTLEMWERSVSLKKISEYLNCVFCYNI